MYSWLWRSLPGPVLARALQALLLALAVVAALFLWVFPWVESQLPYSDVTVPGPHATGSPGPSPSAVASGLPEG
jgi:hypothetical protein